nr:uncharacterized protein LOC112786587 [Arachis hypogaea]
MSEFEKDAPMAVSPMSSYLNTSALNVFIIVVFELEIPIDESKIMQVLKDVFVPLNKRFSSIMIEDKKGKKQWKQVDVNLKEHIKSPIFAKKGLKFYDEEFDEYMSNIGGEKLAQDKPLWEVHLIKYPTRKNNAAGTSVVKLHHSLGDGYTLMGSLLSCVKRVDDPSIPITFPSSHATTSSIKRLPESIFSMFKSASDFGWNILRGSNFIVDDQSPIRPENKEFKHGFGISNISLSLDSFKVVKNKLKVAAAKHVYKTIENSSVSISNVVGPVEQVAFANHPIKGFYFMSIGIPQSVLVTILSYMGNLHIAFGVEKGVIDEHQLLSCFETAKEMIFNAANKT